MFTEPTLSGMSRWSRSEIRRRALHAAARVALLGAVACGQTATQAVTAQPEVRSEAHSSAPDAAEAHADARPLFPDAASEVFADANEALPDAGEALPDAHEALPDAGEASPDAAELLADAGGPMCDELSVANDAGVVTEDAWKQYQACCEANGWDWNRGCQAWGPPVPPEAEVLS
jgi:hypothetical protein